MIYPQFCNENRDFCGKLPAYLWKKAARAVEKCTKIICPKFFHMTDHQSGKMWITARKLWINTP
jgi:hypothetical protein